MLRTTLLAVLLALPLSAASTNVLFLFADDQRPDTISAHGNRYIETPNLDRLVANGYSFRSNYCLGAQGGAVCVPSRAMLNTGKSFFKIPMDMDGHTTLPQLLGQNGYTTFATGKWHNQQPSWLKSFQQGKAIMFGGMSDHTKVPIVDLGPDGNLISERESIRFSSRLFADTAIEFLHNYEDEKPFYAYVAFTAPHDTRNPPPKYRRMYYKRRPPLPPNFAPQHWFDNGQMTGRDESLGPWPRTPEVVSDQLAEYYGLITHLDKQIGRILRKLESTGLAENTIVVYAADHGLAVGSHGLLGKQNLYEHSMGAPLIFSGPGIPKNEETQAFSYLLDIFPTLCSLLGVEQPNDLDGHDLSPIWKGEKTKVRDTIFTSFRDLMKAVRDDRWKLIRYPKIDHTQLFDLANDPYEMKNLADEPSQQQRIGQLTALLKTLQTQYGDDHALTVANPGPKEIDLTGHKRVRDKWQPDWIFDKYFEEPYGKLSTK